MDDKKGEISVGHDGDLVIWRPDTYFEVNVDDIHFKNKLSPYIGKSFYGKVSKTILRGRTVYDCEEKNLFSVSPIGNALLQ